MLKLHWPGIKSGKETYTFASSRGTISIASGTIPFSSMIPGSELNVGNVYLCTSEDLPIICSNLKSPPLFWAWSLNVTANLIIVVVYLRLDDWLTLWLVQRKNMSWEDNFYKFYSE
jgi:hypothetical protein